MIPKIGEKVTMAVRWLDWDGDPSTRIKRGVVKGRLVRVADRGVPMEGFSVDVGDGSQINLWEVDPDFVEGLGWCRGWKGPEVEALKVANALS